MEKAGLVRKTAVRFARMAVIKGGGAAKRESIRGKRARLKQVSPVPVCQCACLPSSLKFRHHNAVVEYLGFITRSSLDYPQMMCAIAEDEIFVKRCILLQPFHTFTQFRFIA